MFKKMQKKFKLSEETTNFIKTVLIVVLCFGVCYLSFLGLDKIGMFENGYTKPESESNEFTYNTAIVGTVFNRPESEYLVSFNEEEKNIYFNTLLDLYEGETQLYKVNMSLGINKEYLSIEGNPGAKKSSDLKIVCPTLIKIKNGKIVKYLEDIEEIREYLSN